MRVSPRVLADYPDAATFKDLQYTTYKVPTKKWKILAIVIAALPSKIPTNDSISIEMTLEPHNYWHQQG